MCFITARPALLVLHCHVYLFVDIEHSDYSGKDQLWVEAIVHGFWGETMPGWNEEGNPQKPKLMFLSPKKANPSPRSPRWLSKHFNMRGNMAAVQCLEVFSLCIVPWKALQYVFHRKPCWLISSLLRADGITAVVFGDLKIAELVPPSSRYEARAPSSCKRTYFQVSAGSHVPKYPVVGPKG